MSFTFPLEIEETILDLLAEDDQGHSALKTCSLVCKAFLPVCRKHIFGSIFLKDCGYPSLRQGRRVTALARLLRETPEIADYIRKLDYYRKEGFYYDYSLSISSPPIQELESLKRISRLKFLSVRGHTISELYWNENPIRPVLLHLLHLPTLTHFKVTNTTNFVVSDLLPCVNLKYLEFARHTTVSTETTFPAALPEHSIQLDEFIAGIDTSTAIMKLCTARRPDGQPIIDFGSLSKITVVSKRLNDDEALQELFRRCHALTSVHLSFKARYRPSLPDMLRPSMQTLKHIVVNVRVGGLDDDVNLLSSIPSELEDMRTKNIIETVIIKIKVDWKNDECYHRGDEWDRLDEVLTTPGWFSLKRVSLTIESGDVDIYMDDELAAALRNLPKSQFPRLSSSNSFSFDFAVILPPPFQDIFWDTSSIFKPSKGFIGKFLLIE